MIWVGDRWKERGKRKRKKKKKKKKQQKVAVVGRANQSTLNQKKSVSSQTNVKTMDNSMCLCFFLVHYSPNPTRDLWFSDIWRTLMYVLAFPIAEKFYFTSSTLSFQEQEQI